MPGTSYLTRATDKKATPQREKIAGTNQKQNSAGGFSFVVDDMERLRRFLILGSEGGSYYVGERKMTLDNLSAVNRAIVQNGPAVVEQIVAVSEAGRAPKNDPALFCLAMCAAYGDENTRRAALSALPKVARIGTHLLHFASFVDSMRGWGRGLRAAVADWYTQQDPGRLAFQIVKYQSRDGWSHSDLLSKAHPKADPFDRDGGETQSEIFKYIKKGWPGVGPWPHSNKDLQIIWAHERAKNADEDELIELIGKYRIPMESVPTEKRTPRVYEAMVQTGGITWLIRNLGNLSKHGVIVTGKWTSVDAVCERLTNEDNIRAGRVHPLSVLLALATYRSGRGQKGDSAWPVVSKVADALERTFYMAFKNVEPTGARYVLALDVSGSMETSKINGGILSAREASAAMALVTSKTEDRVVTIGFTAQGEKAFWQGKSMRGSGYANAVSELPLGKYDRLSESVNYVRNMEFGNTDCALPMLWAMQNGVEADAFVIYTDNETWAGNVHPSQALKQYRDKTGIAARLIVVGMTATEFSIADSNDAGMLDVVGFDSDAPAVISQFVTGNV